MKFHSPIELEPGEGEEFTQITVNFAGAAGLALSAIGARSDYLQGNTGEAMLWASAATVSVIACLGGILLNGGAPSKSQIAGLVAAGVLLAPLYLKDQQAFIHCNLIPQEAAPTTETCHGMGVLNTMDGISGILANTFDNSLK